MKLRIQNAFTLIEVAIVLLVLGLLLGTLLAPISAKIFQKNINYTQDRLEEIQDALLGFLVLHQRLPCPDTDQDGIENKPCNTNLTKIEGELPWRNLGVGQYDAWGFPFRYRVDKEYAETTGIPRSLKTDETNKLKIRNKNSLKFTTEEDYGTLTYSRVVVIVFSQGRNAQADDGNKLTAANDATYVQDFILFDKNNPSNSFDDQLIWLSKHTVLYHLIMAKQWFP